MIDTSKSIFGFYFYSTPQLSGKTTSAEYTGQPSLAYKKQTEMAAKGNRFSLKFVVRKR